MINNKFYVEEILHSLKHNNTVRVLNIHKDPYITSELKARYEVEDVISLIRYKIPEEGLISLEELQMKRQIRNNLIDEGDTVYSIKYNKTKTKYEILSGKVRSIIDGTIFTEDGVQLSIYLCFKTKESLILSLEEE